MKWPRTTLFYVTACISSLVFTHSFSATVLSSSSPVHTGHISSLKVPILTYHQVRDFKITDSTSSRVFITTPKAFEEQMKYLSSNGYSVISLHDLMKAFNGAPLPVKPVIITLDDGYIDQYTYALPILDAYNFKATFFIYTDAISSYGEYMTWRHVLELRQHGMTIGAHTRSHAHLTKVRSRRAMVNEIQGGKDILEKRIGVPVQFFAYPYGLHNSLSVSVVEDAGFLAAFGTDRGQLQRRKNMFYLQRAGMGSDFESFKEAVK